MEEILEVSSTLTASTNDISVRVKYDKFIKGRKIAKNGSHRGTLENQRQVV